MNKKVRKLMLNRETLRNLNSAQLRRVAGGATQSDCAAVDTCACPSDPCATDACSQYPACTPSGVYTCLCSARYCCSFTTNTE